MKPVQILIFIFIILSCSSQIKSEKRIAFRDVPQAIKDTFSMSHPNIETNFHLQVLKGQKTYEANFTVGQDDLSELYSEAGKLIERERTLEINEINSKISSMIKTKLEEEEDSHHKILKVQEVKSEEFNGFEIKVKTKKSKTGVMEYFFSLDGNFDRAQEVELETISTLS